MLSPVFLAILVALVGLASSTGDPDPESPGWRTDGHQYNLQNKLVFGQGGGGGKKRRVVSNLKHKSRQFGEFQGGGCVHICSAQYHFFRSDRISSVYIVGCGSHFFKVYLESVL